MNDKPRQKRFRFRWFYIPLWIVSTLLLEFIINDDTHPFAPQLLAALIMTALSIVPAWYGANHLVPRLLYKRKIGAFIRAILLTALVGTFFTLLIPGLIYHQLSDKPLFPAVRVLIFLAAALFFANTIVITVACAIKIIADRFSLEERLREVEAEKIKTELAFLRAQINPHFLFNVLNTIYFQIQKENVAARSSVEKLSELLRYQLYECTTDKISIAHELAYIKNYVAIQRLRMEADTDVLLTLPTDTGTFKIAPLLILPIVENAFKHISHFKNPKQNKLHITLSNEADNYFLVQVSNTYDKTTHVTHLQASGGLGLENVKRRLTLLYPGAHHLDISRHDHTFETTLKIKYSD